MADYTNSINPNQREVKASFLAANTILRNYHNRGIYDFDYLTPEALIIKLGSQLTDGMRWTNFGAIPGKWNVNYSINSLVPVWWTPELNRIFQPPRAGQ